MAWVKLDDSMPTHPKVMAAGPQAFALDVAGLCYSARHLTDGFIPNSALPALLPGLKTPSKHVHKLIQVGRWSEVEDGWIIHDYHDYQPTSEQVRSDREAAKQRMRRKRSPEQPANTDRSSGEVRANTQRSSDAVRLPRPVPSRPDVLSERSSGPATVENPADGFDERLRQRAYQIVNERAAAGETIRNRDAYAARVMRDEQVRHQVRQSMPSTPLPDDLTDGILTDLEDGP